jgi:hypothetical protein
MVTAGGAIVVGEAPAIRIPPARARTAGLDAAADLRVTRPARTGAPEAPQAARLVWSGSFPLLQTEASDRAGFFVFTTAGDTVGMVAAAPPATESILDLRSVEAFQQELTAAGLARIENLGDSSPPDLAAVLAGRELAPWLLLLAVAILMLESFLGRGFARSSAASGGGAPA